MERGYSDTLRPSVCLCARQFEKNCSCQSVTKFASWIHFGVGMILGTKGQRSRSQRATTDLSCIGCSLQWMFSAYIDTFNYFPFVLLIYCFFFVFCILNFGTFYDMAQRVLLHKWYHVVCGTSGPTISKRFTRDLLGVSKTTR